MRHPLYRLAKTVSENLIPVATIYGGMHRLDLRTDELKELQKLLPAGLPGSSNEQSAKPEDLMAQTGYDPSRDM